LESWQSSVEADLEVKDWGVYAAVWKIYHTAGYMLGKIALLCRWINRPGSGLWEKITRCVCTSRGAM
jgi:hypothetical protein